MKTVLLDSDVVIDFLQGKSRMKEVIISLWENNIAYLSILSVYELYSGMRPKEKEVTDNFINACRIEPVTLEIAKRAGEYRLKYQTKGITLSLVDCIIAETAKTNKHAIATLNVKHYPESLMYL
jgi:predicted nucleic acid-binding protein